MSPVGGVGINLAVQDAVAAARVLGPALRVRRDRPAVGAAQGATPPLVADRAGAGLPAPGPPRRPRPGAPHRPGRRPDRRPHPRLRHRPHRRSHLPPTAGRIGHGSHRRIPRSALPARPASRPPAQPRPGSAVSRPRGMGEVAAEGPPPGPIALLTRFPVLQRIPARLIAIGPLPEHAPAWARRPAERRRPPRAAEPRTTGERPTHRGECTPVARTPTHRGETPTHRGENARLAVVETETRRRGTETRRRGNGDSPSWKRRLGLGQAAGTRRRRAA